MSGERVDGLTLMRATAKWNLGDPLFDQRKDEIGNAISFSNLEYFLKRPVVNYEALLRENAAGNVLDEFVEGIETTVNPTQRNLRSLDLHTSWPQFIKALQLRKLFDQIKSGDGSINQLIALMPAQYQFMIGDLRSFELPIDNKSVAMNAWAIPSIHDLRPNDKGTYRIPVIGRAIGWTQNPDQRPKVYKVEMIVEQKDFEEAGLLE